VGCKTGGVALHRTFEEAYDSLVDARFGYEEIKDSLHAIVVLDPDRDVLTEDERRRLANARFHLEHVRARVNSLRRALHPTQDDLGFPAVLSLCEVSGEPVRVEQRARSTLSGGDVAFECPLCFEEVRVSARG